MVAWWSPAGTSTGGYFDWWIVSLNTNGAIRWQARRDEALSGDEVPAAVFVLADGTTVVSGTGGPVIHDILGNSYMQGVTAGYSPNGTLTVGSIFQVADGLGHGRSERRRARHWRLTTRSPTAPGGLRRRGRSTATHRASSRASTHASAGALRRQPAAHGNAWRPSAAAAEQVAITRSCPGVVRTRMALPAALTVTPQPGMSGNMAGRPVISADGKDRNSEPDRARPMRKR